MKTKNKLKSLLLAGAILTSFGAIKVNALTFAGNKKYNSYDGSFEIKKIINEGATGGLLQYKGKSYIYSQAYNKTDNNLVELTINRNILVNESNIKYNVLDELYPNITKETYYLDGNNLRNISYSVGMVKQSEKNKDKNNYIGNTGLLQDGQMTKATLYNDKIYVENATGMAIDVYDTNYKYLKSFDFNQLLNNIKQDNCTYETYYTLKIKSVIADEDPLIEFGVIETNTETNKKLYKMIFYKYDGTLLTQVSDDKISIDFEHETLERDRYVYKNKDDINFIYKKCDANYQNCKLILSDKNNTKKTIESSTSNFFVSIDNGFITISNYGNSTAKLYDNDFNLIKEYKKTNGIAITKEITNEKEAKYNGFTKGISKSGEDIFEYLNMSYDDLYSSPQLGKYLIAVYPEDEEIETSDFEIFTVNNLEYAKMVGHVKDKTGKILKNYKLELHSTPRTVIIDENGYFKFENVEEGEHTLSIKDANGTELASRKIIFVQGTENKLDGDTLYFTDSTGLSFDLRLDGNTLTLENVTKNIEKNDDENKEQTKEEIKNPKTQDKLLLYGLSLIASISIVGFLIKKSAKVKYCDIK